MHTYIRAAKCHELAQPERLIQCVCLSTEQRSSQAQTFHVTE